MSEKTYTSQSIMAHTTQRIATLLTSAQTLAMFMLVCMQSLSAESLYINYSSEVPIQDLRAYDTCILSAQMRTALPERVHPSQTFLGYLSVCEIAPDAPYRENAFTKGVTVSGKNTTWKSDLIDPSQPSWQNFILNDLAPAIINKGFDGFFLDTAESVEYLAQQSPEKSQQYYAGLSNLVKKLRAQYPKKKIVINRGFAVLPELYDTVDAVLTESLFQAYDYDNNRAIDTPETDTAWLLPKLKAAHKAGLTVYITDFVEPNNHTLAQATAQRILAEGFIPLITTHALMGEVLAPLTPIKREFLALYGRIPKGDFIDWPEDTMTTLFLQMPLEYYGYEVRHHNVHYDGLALPSHHALQGIIIDSSLQLTTEQQSSLIPWLIEHINHGTKLYFLGTLPDLLPTNRERLRKALKLNGSLLPVSEVTHVTLNAEDSIMHFEAKSLPRPESHLHIEAPEDAEVLLRATGSVENNDPVIFDAVFSCDWGGALLQPYLTTLNPEQIPMLQVDIFRYFQKALFQIPAPDTTTRQGARIYYSHIDGDGYLNFSEVVRGSRSGPVILDKIIDHYGLPITASIIESEINGDSTVYQQREDEDFEAMVRPLFAHPLVEASSHTYSHPFFWSQQDRTSAAYATQNVNIDPKYNYATIDYQREIADSLRYMDENLLPEGKQCEIFLWSGNCRPPPEALRITRKTCGRNMNGGNTTITKRAPFQALISPKSLRWGGELQVYAAIQNENVFNNALNNGRFGGFSNVIQTFTMTESPRRLKPVNVYYHFYSADRFDAFTALKRVMDWSSRQPLHPMLASTFFDIVKDSIETGIYQVDDSTWILTNQGHAQTFRLPTSAGYPDLKKSEGILGFSDFQGQRYFHTDGRQRIKLSLTPSKPTRPYLQSAQATVESFAVKADTIELKIHNPTLKELPVTLANLKPSQPYNLQSSELIRIHHSDTQGLLTFNTSPGKSHLSIQLK